MTTEINDRVKELRGLLGLSQIEFCERLQIKQGTLSDIERKRINVSPKTVEKLIQFLNISKEWIYTGNGYIFNNNNDNVKYGINLPAYVPVEAVKHENNEATLNARLKVVSFWQKLLEQDKDIDKTFTALNDLQGLKMDLDIYISRLNSVLNSIDSEVTLSDQKIIMSKSFIETCLNKLSFLKDHYQNIAELNSAIESVLVFVDHDAIANIINNKSIDKV